MSIMKGRLTTGRLGARFGAVLVAAIVLCGGGVAATALVSGQSESIVPAVTSGATTATVVPGMGRDQALRALADTGDAGRSQVADDLPRPVLPPDQAALWIEAWQQQADCMHAHGQSDFPDAPVTFGDGKTPAPLVGGRMGTTSDASSPDFQAASNACPFDTSALDPQIFATASEKAAKEAVDRMNTRNAAGG